MRPTWLLLCATLVAAVLIGAAALAPGMIYVAGVYLALLIVAVIVDARITPDERGLKVSRDLASRLSLGADNPIAIHLENLTARTLQMQIRDEHPFSQPSDCAILRASLPPYTTVVATYTVHPTRRGDYRFGNIVARYAGALGLISRQVSFPAGAPITVYPNLLDIQKYELLARRGRLAEMGLKTAREMGEGTEFSQLRDYQPDDEFRRIDWKATARRGKPMTRELETERSQNILIMVDLGRMMSSSVGSMTRLDYAVNSALMLTYVAAMSGDRVGILTFADRVESYLPPRRGKINFFAALELLYNAQPQMCEPDYGVAFQHLAIKNPRRSLVVLFTDIIGLDASRELVRHVAALWPRHLGLCLTIRDPQLNQAAERQVGGLRDAYEKMVAGKLLQERREAMEELRSHGALSLDVTAGELTAASVNRYLELKARSRI